MTRRCDGVADDIEKMGHRRSSAGDQAPPPALTDDPIIAEWQRWQAGRRWLARSLETAQKHANGADGRLAAELTDQAKLLEK